MIKMIKYVTPSNKNAMFVHTSVGPDMEIGYETHTAELISISVDKTTLGIMVYRLLFAIDGIEHVATYHLSNYSDEQQAIHNIMCDLGLQVAHAAGANIAGFVYDALSGMFGKYHNFKMPKNDVEPVAYTARRLPGINKMVDYPCGHGPQNTLYSVIIHLNDNCGWSREKIADWIDRLHDEGIINAEFDPWEEDQKVEKQPQIDDFKKFKVTSLYEVSVTDASITDINPA